jgi:hypothetical protein
MTSMPCGVPVVRNYNEGSRSGSVQAHSRPSLAVVRVSLHASLLFLAMDATPHADETVNMKQLLVQPSRHASCERECVCAIFSTFPSHTPSKSVREEAYTKGREKFFPFHFSPGALGA